VKHYNGTEQRPTFLIWCLQQWVRNIMIWTETFIIHSNIVGWCWWRCMYSAVTACVDNGINCFVCYDI